MRPSPAEQEDTCSSKGARIGRSGGHTVGVDHHGCRQVPHPPWQAPPEDPTAQARAAPAGPPRGPFACGTPRGQVHGRCRKAHLRVEPTAGQAFRAGTVALSRKAPGKPSKWRLSFMEGRQEGVEPLDRAMICRLWAVKWRQSHGVIAQCNSARRLSDHPPDGVALVARYDRAQLPDQLCPARPRVRAGRPAGGLPGRSARPSAGDRRPAGCGRPPRTACPPARHRCRGRRAVT
jgi:hypothetical protein